MVVIESVEGIKKDIECIGCAIQRKEIKPIGGIIAETRNFNVEQDYEFPIIGFFVIASKRHIIGFADFNEKEKKEFIDIICQVRKAMRDILNIKYIQILFREDTVESKTNPSHFHIALLPKYKWMDKFSSTKDILEYARKNLKTEEEINKIKEAAKKLKEHLMKFYV